MNNPFRYSSYYTDAESGMSYCAARYYSPELMTWISRDSWSVPNRYGYCSNNPVSMTDPKGHDEEDILSSPPVILSMAFFGTVFAVAAVVAIAKRLSGLGAKTATVTQTDEWSVVTTSADKTPEVIPESAFSQPSPQPTNEPSEQPSAVQLSEQPSTGSAAPPAPGPAPAPDAPGLATVTTESITVTQKFTVNDIPQVPDCIREMNPVTYPLDLNTLHGTMKYIGKKITKSTYTFRALFAPKAGSMLIPPRLPPNHVSSGSAAPKVLHPEDEPIKHVNPLLRPK